MKVPGPGKTLVPGDLDGWSPEPGHLGHLFVAGVESGVKGGETLRRGRLVKACCPGRKVQILELRNRGALMHLMQDHDVTRPGTFPRTPLPAVEGGVHGGRKVRETTSTRGHHGGGHGSLGPSGHGGDSSSESAPL